ncbi:conserved hypothetical protein [Ricinus communis]|uniref:Uncharacterized protein n=1 Tax=Ricinus communis TaxID=3988 RepID=B9SDA7_RICCO|nr:conserved hypothetical protein [Ricinus communis]
MSLLTKACFRILLDMLLVTTPHMDHMLHTVILLNNIPTRATRLLDILLLVDILQQVILLQVAILLQAVTLQLVILQVVTLQLVIPGHQVRTIQVCSMCYLLWFSILQFFFICSDMFIKSDAVDCLIKPGAM